VQKNGIRTGYSAPLTSRELAIDVQRVFGDLISYQNDGKGYTIIAGNVGRT
jgi:hypothetical protein